MSINQSPPEWAHSPNISILKRVTSRVSQWFSPTTNTSPNSSDQQQSQEPGIGEDATSREYNSHHRRRCSDIISPDVAVEEAKTQPPLKRSKTTIVEERNTMLRSTKTTLTSSTPTTSLLNSRRRLRSGFAGTSEGVAAKPFDFSSLGSASAIGSSFNPDLVRNYKGVMGQEDTKRQVVLGYSGENDGDGDEVENDEDDDEEEEEVNPDDEVQIVIKPAKSYLDHNVCVDEDEDGDILTELNVQRKEHHHHHQLGGKRSGVNGSDKDGLESGSESAGSQDSSCMNVNLLSKRRKLGLSRMIPTATQKNGSSVGSSINFTSHLQSSKSLFSDKNILASAGPSSLNASTTSLNSLAPKRSFNAGLYGSMSALSDSRLLNIKSPYYNAPTMFGGASAYSQKPLYAGIKAGGGANKLFRSNTGLPMMRPSSSLSSLSMIGGGSGSNASGGLERSASGLAGTSGGNRGDGSPKGTARRVLDLINQLNSPLEEIRKMASGSLLNDSNAKRLPSLVGQRSRFSAERSLSGASSGIRMNSPKTPYSRVGAGQQQDKQRSPLTTELQVPSMPQLLQMNKLQRSTEEIRRLAFQSRGGLNQETEYKLPGGESATEGVSKMKVKLNRMAARGGSSSVDGGAGASEKDGGEAVEVPKFPEIKFPDMKEMPKIDIKLPTAAPASVAKDEAKRSKGSEQANHAAAPDTSKSVFNSNGAGGSSSFSFNSKPSAVGTATPTPLVLGNFSIFSGAPTASPLKASSAVSSPRAGEFQFAAPIALKTDAAAAAFSPLKMNFTFSEPTSAAGVESTAPVPAAFGAFKFNPGTAKVKEGFSATPPKDLIESAKELKKGSVEDFLGLAPKPATPAAMPTAFGDKFKPAADTWSCDVCMVRNKAADLKCLACETPKEPAKVSKPVAATPLVVDKPKDDGFKALIAAQRADKWECGDCMLKNEQSALKCICCESPKPGAAAAATAIKSEPAKINSSNPFAPASGSSGFAFGFKAAAPAATTTNLVPEMKQKTADEGFGQLLSTQQAKWECSTCMTRNEQSRSKCACCEQAKPGAESEKVPQFSFGAVSNSNKFSFGMPAAKVEEQDRKPVAPLAGGFSFGAGSSKPAPSDGSATPAKFAFGMGSTPAKVEAPTETVEEKKRAEEAVRPTVPSLAGFKFGITSQTTTATAAPPVAAESKPSPAKEITPIGGFKFGVSSSAAAAATTVKPAVGGFTFGAPTSLLGSASTEVKKTEEVSAVVAEEKKKAEAAPASTTFAFGSSPATPSAPLFGAAAVKDDAPKKIESVASPVFGAAASTPLFGAAKEAASTAAKGINFGSAAPSATTSSPFAFGSAAATTTSESANKPQPLFGSPSSVAIKTVAFGSPATTATNEIKSPPSEAPKTTFAFGSAALGAKSDAPKVFGSSTSSTFAFGQPSAVVAAPAAAATTSSPFGMVGTEAAKPAAPLFGGMSSGTPSFGAPAPVSTFGSGMTSSPFGGAATAAPAKPAESTPSLFGSASRSSNNSPFGSNAAPLATGMFGGVTAAPQNNVPAFGSSAPTMTGNSFDVKDGPGASPFQFGSASGAPSITSNNNQNRSFVFGGAQQAQQQQQPQENKQAFNFNAGMTPNFNFGGGQPSAAEPQQQVNHQPFAFGGAPQAAAPAQGMFNFTAGSNETGSTSTPGFQFNATTNNPFYPVGQPSSNNTGAQQGRRILKARRTQPR